MEAQPRNCPLVMSAEGVVSKALHSNIEKLQLATNIFTIGQRAILNSLFTSTEHNPKNISGINKYFWQKY